MGIRTTKVALCNCFVDAPQKAQYRQAGIFYILSISVLLLVDITRNVHFWIIRDTLSGRSNWNFTTKHFTKSLLTN